MDMNTVEGKGILEITSDILDWAIIIIIRREFTTNIYLLFARREVRIGRNCASGREYRYSRPRAEFRYGLTLAGE